MSDAGFEESGLTVDPVPAPFVESAEAQDVWHPEEDGAQDVVPDPEPVTPTPSSLDIPASTMDGDQPENLETYVYTASRPRPGTQPGDLDSFGLPALQRLSGVVQAYDLEGAGELVKDELAKTQTPGVPETLWTWSVSKPNYPVPQGYPTRGDVRPEAGN